MAVSELLLLLLLLSANMWWRRLGVSRRHQSPGHILYTVSTCSTCSQNWVPSAFRWFGFSSAGLSNLGGYRRNAWYNLSCLLESYLHLNTNEKLSVSWQVVETCGVKNYGSGWRKDVVKQYLEFNMHHCKIYEAAVAPLTPTHPAREPVWPSGKALGW